MRPFIFQGHVYRRRKRKQRSARKFLVRPGRTTVWWDGFAKGIVVEEEWKENFRMSLVNFLKLCNNFVYTLEGQQSCVHLLMLRGKLR